MEFDHARRRLAESRRAEDLRADVAVQPDEREAVDLADARDRGRGIRQREAELLILVRRREEVVGLGVHAAVDAHEHRLHGVAALDDRGEALELDPAVDHDRADAHLDGALELGDRLVVAVEAEASRVGAGGEGDRELSPGAHVDREALFGDPADHLGATGRPCRRSRRGPACRARQPPRGTRRGCGGRSRAPRPRRGRRGASRTSRAGSSRRCRPPGARRACCAARCRATPKGRANWHRPARRAQTDSRIGCAERQTRVGPIGGSFDASPSGPDPVRRVPRPDDSLAGQPLKSMAPANAAAGARRPAHAPRTR